MSVPELARQILSDMWEYGRVVLILVFLMAAHGFMIGRSEDDGERSSTQSGLIRIALGTVGVFALFSFLNSQAANILALMRISRMWGLLTRLAFLSVVVVLGITAYRYLAAKRAEKALSISDEQLPQTILTSKLKLSWSGVALLFLVSTIWLCYLAKG